MIGETRVFLKSKAKIDRKKLSKSRYSTQFRARFVRREKSLVKKLCNKKKRSFYFLSFEGTRIDFGASEPKLRRFEIRRFCDKMRPFCTISAGTLENPPRCMYVCTYVCMYVCVYVCMYMCVCVCVCVCVGMYLLSNLIIFM